MHYETGVGGTAQLNYSNPLSRYLWVIMQVLLWAIVVIGILQPDWHRRRSRKKFDVSEMPPIVYLLDEVSGTVES